MRLQRSILITVGRDAADIARYARDELSTLKLAGGTPYPGQLTEIIAVPVGAFREETSAGEDAVTAPGRSEPVRLPDGAHAGDLQAFGADVERALRRLKSRELTLALEHDFAGVQPDPRVQCFIVAHAAERGAREALRTCLQLLHGAYPGGDLPLETSCFVLLPGFYSEACTTEEERNLLYGEAFVTLWSLENWFTRPEDEHLRQDLLGNIWVVDSQDETGQYAGPIDSLKHSLGEMIAALISSSLVAASRRSPGRPFKSLGCAQLVFDRERAVELVSEEVVAVAIRQRTDAGQQPLATTVAAEASALVENLRLAHIGEDAGAETATAFPKAPSLELKERQTTADFLAATHAAIRDWEARVFPPLKERLRENSSRVREQRFAGLRNRVVALVDADSGGLSHASALLDDLCGGSNAASPDGLAPATQGRLRTAACSLRDEGVAAFEVGRREQAGERDGDRDETDAPGGAHDVPRGAPADAGPLPPHDALLAPLRGRIDEQESEIQQIESARATCELEMARHWSEVVHLRNVLLRIALPVYLLVAVIALAAASFRGYAGVAFFIGAAAAGLAALVAASFYLVHRRAYRWFRQARADEEKHRETLRGLETRFCDRWREYFDRRLQLLELDAGIQELRRVVADLSAMQSAIACFLREAEVRAVASPEARAALSQSCTTMQVVSPQDLPFIKRLIGAKPADDAAKFFVHRDEGGHRLSEYLFPSPRLDALAGDLARYAEQRYRPRVDAISAEDLTFDHYGSLIDNLSPTVRVSTIRTLMSPLVQLSETARRKRAQHVIYSFGVGDTETSRFRDVVKSIGGLEGSLYFPVPGGDRFTAIAVVDSFALRELAQAGFYRASLLQLADPSSLLPSGVTLAAVVGTEGSGGNEDASTRSLLLCAASLGLSPMDGLSGGTDELLKRLEGAVVSACQAPKQVEELERVVRELEDGSSQAVREGLQQRIFQFIQQHRRALSQGDIESLDELALKFAPVL
jgi:hypothetical protein